MNKYYIFDFDGVIADSLPIAFEVAKMSRASLTLDGYKNKFKTNINSAKFTEPITQQGIDFQAEFAKRMMDLELTPAKKNVLQSLSEMFDFHIISSTDTKTIQLFCESNNIHQYFGDILGVDVEPSKVKKFQYLFSRYNLDPKELIFITDTIGDIKEAREVGIGKIIAVADGYQDRAVLETAQPTHVIDSLVDAEKILT